MSLPDVHPDGDPFAAQDRERDANSWLGKLEARAQLEDRQLQAQKQHEQMQQSDAPSSELVSSPAPATRKPPSSASASASGSALNPAARILGTDSNAKQLIMIDSTDDEADNLGGPEPDTEDGLTTAAPSEAPEPNDQDMDAVAASGLEDEEEEEEEEEEEAEGSGTEADEGSEDDEDDDGTPQVDDDAAEDESEEESEDDSDDDDTNSMTSERAPRIKDGEIEGEVVGPDGVRLSPKKKSSTGEDGDVEMKDGEDATPGEEGADGQPAEKKKRRRRAPRTPTPPPLAPKERRATVRLSIALPPRKDDSAPDFNIQQLAKDAGFVKEDEPEKPEEEDEDDEGSESDGQGGRRKKGKQKANGEGEGTPGANEPPKKRRKRGPNVVLGRFGGYDVNDPFVDDEEVALYEPRYSAKPLREGYFVCAGDVDVAARRGRVKGSKNKPKVDENGNPIAPSAARRRSGKVVIGADGKPVAETPEAGPSGAHSPAVVALPSFGAPSGPPPPKQRKKGEFSPELQEKLDMLKVESDKEPWIIKNKFPPALKDKLVEVAEFALDIGEYDEEFYNIMPKIFPYNLFTMKKLIKREVYPKRIRDLNEEQDEQLQIIKQGVDRHYCPQRADFERRLAEYERKLAEGDGTTASGAAMNLMRRTPEPAAGPIFGHSPAIATPLIATVDGLDGFPAPGKEEDEKTKEVEEPKWRFRLDETMRAALYRASEIEDKKSELTVEKQELEKATTRTYDREKPYSTKTARKVLYEKILELWPPGAMNSNLLSREISNYKLKLKKQGDLPSGPGP